MAPAVAVPPRAGSRGAALGTVLAVLFLTFLDTTIVSVTLGNLETDVSAGVIPLQWVINAYALVFASLMLLGGLLGDRLGRKRVMLGGIVIFSIGSLMCAVASGVALVIAGRAVMDRAAASEPGTLSVIRQLYPQRGERARALGAWSAVSGLALASGPVIGGPLVGASGWHAVFWFNLIVALVLLAAVAAFVPDSRDPQPGRMDLAGPVLGAAGLGCVIYAAIAGEYKGYGTTWIIALFVLGGLCLIGFGAVEARVRNPMLNLTFMRKPIVGSALFAAFAVYFGVFAIFFFTALYLDIALQYSGLKLAGMFAPMAVAIVLGGLAAGPWVGRAGSRLPTALGCLLAAAGMLLARYELGHGDSLTFGLLALALALAGLGFGVTVVPLTSAVLSHVPARHSGMAASATNTARQLGAVVGVAALGAIVNSQLVTGVKDFAGPFAGSILPILETGGSSGTFSLDDIPSTVIKAFLDGLQLALLISVLLILLAGLIAALVREPAAAEDEPVGQLTSTGSTSPGSAPPSTSSTGSA